MQKKKPSTIPEDYLSTVLEAPNTESTKSAEGEDRTFLPEDYFSALTQQSKSRSPKSKKRSRGKKPRMTFHLSRSLCERIRNVGHNLSTREKRVTFSALAELGLEREIKRLEKKHNDGNPFPRRRRRRGQRKVRQGSEQTAQTA